MQYVIGNNSLQVTIDSKGAELVSIKKEGKEMLWQNQTGAWAGHAPMLFPVCGHFGFIYKGKEYEMPAHGFARKKEFSLIERSEKAISFSLSSDEKTKELYPFDFTLVHSYTLEGNKLTASTKICNLSKETMFFTLGSHESYMLELPLEAYKAVFPQKEKLVHHEHDEEGYLTGETIDFGVSDTYSFKEDDLLESKTLIFKDIQSGSVKLCKNTGEEVLSLTFNGFNNLLFWRPERVQMVCIEPWFNLPDKHGNTQEFAEKEGVASLLEGEEKTFIRTIEYK